MGYKVPHYVNIRENGGLSTSSFMGKWLSNGSITKSASYKSPFMSSEASLQPPFMRERLSSGSSTERAFYKSPFMSFKT